MAAMLDMIVQLGINKTAFVQFAMFVVTCSILTFVVFKPYFQALEIRKERTKGGEELALDLTKQAHALQNDFQTEARALHQQIQELFQKSKQDANRDAEKVISEAKSEAQAQQVNNEKIVASTAENLRKSLDSESQGLANLITNKLLAR